MKIYIYYILYIIHYLCGYTQSYSYFSHSYLGNMTEEYLTKYETDILLKINKLTNNEKFSNMSIWADSIKRRKGYAWTKTLHYIDILQCKIDNNEIYNYCNNKCIVSGLLNFTNEIKYNMLNNNFYNKENMYEISELFKFILHFTQDFNQPLHLYGIYSGGNDFKIIRNKNGRNRTYNLHSFWDSELPEYFIKNYNFSFDRIIYRDINNMIDYKNFIEEILQKNLKIPCNSDIDFYQKYIIFEEYFKKEIFEELFNNYLYFIIHTLRFIFN